MVWRKINHIGFAERWISAIRIKSATWSEPERVRRLKRPDRDILTSKKPQFGVISGASPDLA